MKKKIKKVLLFIPPADTFKDNPDINPVPPLGLGYLAAVLEKNGIDVNIVDCLIEGWDKRFEIGSGIIRVGLPFDDIERKIRSYAPDVVGVNNLFTKQRGNAHKIYELAKNIDENIVTIAGGAHPTAMPELVLSDDNVDYVVLGEGEESLLDLINAVEGRSDFSMVDGFGYKKDGEIRIAPKTKFIKDLDALPFPARHLMSMEKYFGIKESHGERKFRRFSPIVTSRGCGAGCVFCSAHKVWGKKFRSRSPENVINEMKHLKADYGIEEIMFEDDNVTLDPMRAEALFDGMIKEKLSLKWDTPNGVAAWTLNERLIHKMKESGCYKLNLAFESGNQFVLDNIIKKPLNIDKVKPLARYAKNIGLDIGIFLVMGMPGETIDQMWDSFYLARDLGVYLPHVSIATPYPGTELYDLCKNKKYLKEGFSLDDLYIRSFSITAEGWDGEKLKKTFREGQTYLMLSFIKDHPFIFISNIFFKALLHPVRYIRRLINYLNSVNPVKIKMRLKTKI